MSARVIDLSTSTVEETCLCTFFLVGGLPTTVIRQTSDVPVVMRLMNIIRPHGKFKRAVGHCAIARAQR